MLSGSVTSKALKELIKLQGHRCALSGVELSVDTVSLDHIQAMQDGGKDDMSNVQLVHSIINTMKGTMSDAQFVEWCQLVSDHKRKTPTIR